MEITEEKNGVAPVENNVVPSGNNDSNVFEDCTTDNPIDEGKYEKYLFVTNEAVTMVDPDEVKMASPFKDLFPVKTTDLENIEQDMKTNGFDSVHPILIWAGHNMTVIDGHTRLAAAQKLMFSQIPAIIRNFKDEAEALEYAIKSQRNRRNLTDADLLRCVTELEKRMKEGRPEKTATRVAVNGRSSENTAKLLGTSRGKVEKIRTINDHASDEVKEAVKSGKMSINKAYNKTLDARRQEEYKSDSVRRTDMHFKVEKDIPKMAKDFMVRLMENNPDILFPGAEARIIYQNLCKELMNIVNMATVPGEQLKQD